jgi:hypothetical protein
MTVRKQRVTITLDPELVSAGNRAVASGAAQSLSHWISGALTDKARRDEQLARLGDAIADFESEFGEITPEELADQRRADRVDAVVAGELLRATRTSDVIDAALVVLAVDDDEIVTVDRDDFAILAAAADRHVELVRP